MSDRLDLDLVREKRARWLVWAESLVILGLLTWVSIEYENNLYLQAWVSKTVGPLDFFLNGTLAGLYAGALVGYSIAVYTSKRPEEEKVLESLTRKKIIE